MLGRDLVRVAVLAGSLSLLSAGCHGHKRHPAASPLGVVSLSTPPVRVAGIKTSGSYPRFAGDGVDLRRVNAALGRAIVADQRGFAPRSRGVRTRGFYELEFRRDLISASSIVASALLLVTSDVLPLQSSGEHWLAVTVHVPSGEPVRLADLFANPDRTMRAIQRRIPRQALTCARGRTRYYVPPVRKSTDYALFPRGLVLGFGEDPSCAGVVASPPFAVTVPYRVLQPYLNDAGASLVNGVRPPAFRPDGPTLSYCRLPDFSGAELSASGTVPCATARSVEGKVFSRPCVAKNRCETSGFTCLAFWSGHYDRPFDFTHHAICHDGRRRIVADEG